MSNRLRSFHVSQEILRLAFHMPEGTIIHRVIEDPLTYGASFRFIVSHPDLPEIAEAQEIPEVTPSLRHAVYIAGECSPDRVFKEIVWEWDYEPQK